MWIYTNQIHFIWTDFIQFNILLHRNCNFGHNLSLTNSDCAYWSNSKSLCWLKGLFILCKQQYKRNTVLAFRKASFALIADRESALIHFNQCTLPKWQSPCAPAQACGGLWAMRVWLKIVRQTTVETHPVPRLLSQPLLFFVILFYKAKGSVVVSYHFHTQTQLNDYRTM